MSLVSIHWGAFFFQLQHYVPHGTADVGQHVTLVTSRVPSAPFSLWYFSISLRGKSQMTSLRQSALDQEDCQSSKSTDMTTVVQHVIYLLRTKNGSFEPSSSMSAARRKGPAVPMGSFSCSMHLPFSVQALCYAIWPRMQAELIHAAAVLVLLTCEHVILMCSFSSHSFKKSIMT